ncbi:hypothetical protein CTI12_AA450160 [Artemisia annua]|uniref:S-protein homolog n=1 Tax=Artemisia annua TaxID=35608 RepID=A0A2U1LVF4_ARTAN|nr:hypothetical protein CTI12_AA450160 [Artemisia annua]
MGHTTKYLFLLVLTLYHAYTVISAFEQFRVYIMDAQVRNLVAHISSKNNDLGNKTLTINQEFSWEFREAIGDSTVFVGQFFWMPPDNIVAKEVHFNVFDSDVARKCGQSLIKKSQCYWLVNDIGFYFAKDKPKNFALVYNW